MGVKFKDNRVSIYSKLDDNSLRFLEEAKDLMASATARLTPVDTGQLKNSFTTDSVVDEGKGVAYIGSSLEHSIWVEMGTGEYALNGNGRKGSWTYRDPKTGKFRKTKGQPPKRMLYRAFINNRRAIERRAKEVIGEKLSDK